MRLANAEPVSRRNGDCAGSVSRITSAETTRWTRNWYDWSWSRLEAMSPLRSSANDALHDRAAAPACAETGAGPA